MKRILIVAVVLVCLLVMGCASITTPVSATSNALGSKVGQASGKIWLGMFGTADAGIRAAAEAAGIKVVTSVDITQKLGILGLWVEYEVTVTGN